MVATEDTVAAIPTTMQAAVIREHGDADSLKVSSAPVPRPKPGEALLRVLVTALNHLDVFAREGMKGPGVPPVRLPHVSGVDIVGVVAEYGPSDSNEPPSIAVGERVLLNPSYGCGSCRWCRQGEPSMCPEYKIVGEHVWGGLAEYVVVPARNLIRVPDHIDSVTAAAVPAVYTTAWRGVVTVGQVKPSDRVLVVGASGGLGSAQLQIAVAAGARVAGTASTPAKRAKGLALGAEAMFDSTANWEDEARAWAGEDGVDLVLDSVGIPTFRSSLRCLGMGGRLVLSGATGGDRGEISIREIYQWHRKVLGAPMGNWEDFLQVTDLVWRGLLLPQIHAVYSLDQIAQAERELEERRHFGKIVIVVAGA